MPMVAIFYHHDGGTAPPFVVLTPYEARHCFVEHIALDCNVDGLQAMDGTPPGAVTTIGAGGPEVM